MTQLGLGEPEVVSNVKTVGRFLAIDPGSRHVGYAMFTNQLIGVGAGAWRCEWAKETQPPVLYQLLADWLDEDQPKGQAFYEVVIEDFVISLKLLQNSQGGVMSKDANLTIECIGGVKLMCAFGRVPMVRQQPNAQHKALRDLAQKGIADNDKALVSAGWGPHAKSAELHGWYRVFQMMKMAKVKNAGGIWTPGEGGVVRGWA